MKEFQAVIKNMKNKKAEGTDKIANEMIKHFPEKLLNLILALFNKFLEKGQITHEWCLGLITVKNSVTFFWSFFGLKMVSKSLTWYNLICVCDSKIKFHHQMPNNKDSIRI